MNYQQGFNKHSDRDILLVALSGEVPPAWWWFSYSDEKSRKSWDEVRKYFQKVYWRVKSYFAGVKLSFPELDPLDEEFYQLNAALYIRLYDLIWENWEEVQSELYLLYGLTKWDFFRVETPGECLRKIILEDCLCFYLEQREETNFTPRSLYELFSLQGKVGNLKVKENLSNSDQKTLKKFDRYKKRLEAFGKPHVLLDNCLAVCRDSKSNYARNSLKFYDQIRGDLKRVITARNHPNRRRSSVS